MGISGGETPVLTIADWCLLAAVLLFLLTIAPIKPLAGRAFDNRQPRSAAFYHTPLRQRALGAHQNGIETYPFFATAVLLAEFHQAAQGWIDALAIAFVVSRLFYVAAYVGDRSTVRTALWNIGFGFNLGIFLLAGYGPAGAKIGIALGLAWAAMTAAILLVLDRRR
jgi:uncharacterized MAPEG superfamily protein